ncbi:hypothetical protein DFH09DRAFT_1438603 [Mycena vulgaris]|nr:hypothetical protein DFH09DRAFT_1438603 [Mycena vulgaris]
MLVSWRIRELVQALLFRIVCIDDDETIDALPNWTVNQYARFSKDGIMSFAPATIRHLFIRATSNDSMHDANTILAACTGVKSLFLSSRAKDLDYLSAKLFPERRQACLANLFSGSIDFRHPSFRHITHHADLAGWPDAASGLSLIPNLTYLAMLLRGLPRQFPALLQKCQKLQSILWLAFEEITQAPSKCDLLREDPRLGAMLCVLLLVASGGVRCNQKSPQD